MGDNENPKGIDIEYKPLSDKPNSDVVKNENDYEKKVRAVIEHNRRFLIANESKMIMWHGAHKNASGKSPNPPVFKDKDGKYFWANRKARKRMAKIKRGKL